MKKFFLVLGVLLLCSFVYFKFFYGPNVNRFVTSLKESLDNNPYVVDYNKNIEVDGKKIITRDVVLNGGLLVKELVFTLKTLYKIDAEVNGLYRADLGVKFIDKFSLDLDLESYVKKNKRDNKSLISGFGITHMEMVLPVNIYDPNSPKYTVNYYINGKKGKIEINNAMNIVNSIAPLLVGESIDFDIFANIKDVDAFTMAGMDIYANLQNYTQFDILEIFLDTFDSFGIRNLNLNAPFSQEELNVNVSDLYLEKKDSTGNYDLVLNGFNIKLGNESLKFNFRSNEINPALFSLNEDILFDLDFAKTVFYQGLLASYNFTDFIYKSEAFSFESKMLGSEKVGAVIAERDIKNFFTLNFTDLANELLGIQDSNYVIKNSVGEVSRKSHLDNNKTLYNDNIDVKVSDMFDLSMDLVLSNKSNVIDFESANRSLDYTYSINLKDKGILDILNNAENIKATVYSLLYDISNLFQQDRRDVFLKYAFDYIEKGGDLSFEIVGSTGSFIESLSGSLLGTDKYFLFNTNSGKIKTIKISYEGQDYIFE